MKQYSGEVEFAMAADRDGPEGGQSAIRHFLDSGFKPTALICMNDFMAFGVLIDWKPDHADDFENIAMVHFPHAEVIVRPEVFR